MLEKIVNFYFIYFISFYIIIHYGDIVILCFKLSKFKEINPVAKKQGIKNPTANIIRM